MTTTATPSHGLTAARLFVAIPLAADVLGPLEQLQARLESRLPARHVRWTRPDQIHLTLVFLGQVERSHLGDVTAALAGAVHGIPIIPLALGPAGAFPDLKRPKIFWAGLSGQVERLIRAQNRVQAAMAPFMERPEDRTFHPHLTLGRVRTGRRIGPLSERVFESLTDSLPSREWLAERIELVESRLSREGAVYEVRSALPLREP